MSGRPNKGSANGSRKGVPPSTRSRARVQETKAIDLAKRAVEARVRGKSIREVAAELGCAPSTALQAVRRGLALTIEATKVPAEQLRAQETERLETALLRVMDVLGSDDDATALKAAAEVRQISGRLSALHGLDAPTKVDATVEDKTPPRARLDALLEGLAAKLAAREGAAPEAAPSEAGGETPPG